MAELLPNSRLLQEEKRPRSTSKSIDNVSPYATGFYNQEHEHYSKPHYMICSRRPCVLRCSSFEKGTSSGSEIPSPSLSVSLGLEEAPQSPIAVDETIDLSVIPRPHHIKQFVQYTNGCRDKQYGADQWQTGSHFPYTYGTSTDQSPSIDLPAHVTSSCFGVAMEHKDLRNVHPSSSNHFTNWNSYKSDSRQSHLKQKSSKVIFGSCSQKQETSKNETLMNSVSVEPLDLRDTRFNTWSSNNEMCSFRQTPGSSSGLATKTTSSKYEISASPPKYGGYFRNKEPAHVVEYENKNAKKTCEYARKLSSQSYSDITRTNTRQSLNMLSRTSSGDFAYNSMNCGNNTSVSFTATKNSFTAGSPYYVNLPRRCSSAHVIRRTVSHEPRIEEMKPMRLRTPSLSEVESEYVTLDNSYVPHNYTRLSEGIEDTVYYQKPHVNSFTQPHPNGSDTRADRCHDYVADSGPLTAYTVAACTNQAWFNSSMLKVNTLSHSRKHTSKKKSGGGPLRSVAETIGSMFSYRSSSNSPRLADNLNDSTAIIEQATHTSYRRGSIGELHNESARTLIRSKSLSDLQKIDKMGTETNLNYSDDEDGDDFGFLSYPISFMNSCTSAAMNKAKSPTPSNRIFTKRWRSKSNAVPTVPTSVAMWTPGPQTIAYVVSALWKPDGDRRLMSGQGSCAWSSVSGRRVQLRPVSILSLTEAERLALQKIALSKLQSMDIGCTISIPKDPTEPPKAKKSPLSLKKRSKSVSASALDTMAKDGTSLGSVFGIPLLRCILNDRKLDKRKKQLVAVGPAESPSSLKMRTDSSDNFLVFRSARKSSSSSQGSVDISVTSQRLESLTVPPNKRTASSGSLSESESSHNTNSSLIDALSLSTSNPASSRPSSLAIDGSHVSSKGEAQVPYVVRSCFKHIETYGLQTLGIFRVGCSKKRVKQLREEFDCGKEVMLTDEHNPHDVGALLKEFFRDLPEPLLTRELYLPFLHAEKIKDEHKRHIAVSLLISMLPVPNRDTLWALLRFLAVVSYHAQDGTDDKGAVVSGNKMDSHNLATLFGPNILHRTRVTSDKEMISESVERVEQSKEVIEVVKGMIDNHHELFEISGSLRDDVLRLLVESNQETVNKVLRHLANQNQIETDPESMCSVFEESINSPVLYHTTSSDADIVAFARKQAARSHCPLRVTKSADDSLDLPISNLIDPHFPEYQVLSQVSRKSDKIFPINSTPVAHHGFDSGQSYSSPATNRIPVLKMPHETSTPEVVLQGRLDPGNFERPYSEGFHQNLNIPRPFYLREDSSSSISSGLSSPLYIYSGSDNGQFGQWILPTPPTSRASSPKPLFRSASSSSTLIASPVTSHFNNNSDENCENNKPTVSTEWENERWKHWQRIAAQKTSMEAEQETLV